MACDHFINRDIFKEYIKKNGYEPFIDSLNQAYDLGLYSCSTAWEEDSTYILKAKGSYGDVVIGWKGVHDHD